MGRPLLLLLLLATVWDTCQGFSSNHRTLPFQRHQTKQSVSFATGWSLHSTSQSSNDDNNNNDSEETTTTTTTKPSTPPPPILNGKMVLPYQILINGLEGHTISAVYAVLSSNYKRGQDGDGWEKCVGVGVSMDLQQSLVGYAEETSQDKCFVRALSFSFPQEQAMNDVASQWRELARKAGAQLQGTGIYDLRQEQLAVMEAMAMMDDDDDDDDDDWDLDDVDMASSSSLTDSQSTAVVSPFASTTTTTTSKEETVVSSKQQEEEEEAAVSGDAVGEFSVESVDRVLDEVRPYLISDGGNVSVERVNVETKDVYLKLEGACGSCASSTVTMQMGIERVLKENFADLGSVIKVEDNDDDGAPTQLTYEAIESELKRIQPAILAMGGVVRIQKVDSELGVVEINFRGGSKVQQGLELALLDVPFVRHVKFVQ